MITTCAMNTIDDVVEPFDGLLECGFYQLDKDIELMRCLKLPKGVRIHADFVYELLKRGIIKRKDIALQYKPANVLPVNYFSDVIDSIMKDFPTKVNEVVLWKQFINMWIGCCNRKGYTTHTCT